MTETKTEEKGIATIEFSSAEKKMMRDVYASEASEIEFDFFMAVAKRRKLNPLAGQIFLIPFGGKRIPVVSIHGLITIAARTGNYAGATPVQFMGDDNKWVDFWDQDIPPRAAKIGVYMKGVDHPTMAIATWKQSAKYKSKGVLREIWAAYPADMLEKCALAKAVRRAFPDDAGGLYTAEEFGHAGIADITHEPTSPQNEHQQQAATTTKAGYSDNDTMPFGKHKDQKWCDLPPEYLDWIMSNIKDKPDIRERCAWEIDKRAGSLEPEPGNIQNGDVLEDAPIDGPDMDPVEYRKRILTDIRNHKDSMDKDTFGILYKEFAAANKVRNFADKGIPIEALVEFADKLKDAFDKELDGDTNEN